MKLVVGLGNPGPKYEGSRHNAGFEVIDELARRYGIACDKHKWQALVGECRIGGDTVWLCKPQTYMNLSGVSVSEAVRFYSEVRPERDLILIYDDMDFPPGQLRLREKGSAGGHNGVKSVIQHLGTDVFPRVRLGIGRPEPGEDVVSYVLRPFPPAQQELVDSMVQRAADAVEFALEHSFSLAMNRFNQR